MQAACENMQILGSGGYGLVLANPCEKKVNKLMYVDACGNAENEYRLQMRAYRAIIHRNLSHVVVPRPLEFEQTLIVHRGKAYSCGMSMELMKPPPLHPMLVHCILNDDAPAANALVGRRYKEPISAENPARGFFASADYVADFITQLPLEITKKLSTIESVAFAVGQAVATFLTIGRIIPLDVEFTLGLSEKSKLQVVALDFGLAEVIAYNASCEEVVEKAIMGNGLVGGLDSDLYIPQPGSDLFVPFASGVHEGWSQKKTNMSAERFLELWEKLASFEKNAFTFAEQSTPFHIHTHRKRRGSPAAN